MWLRTHIATHELSTGTRIATSGPRRGVTVRSMTEDRPPRLPYPLPPVLKTKWLSWLRDQHGLVDTEQLAMLGVTPAMVTANLEACRWQRVLPRVYATFTGPLTRPARITAALLYAGPRAVLSHQTAAEEWRMTALDPASPVHVTVPYGCSAVSQPPHVVVHRSRAFEHIAVGTHPPRTRRADTAVDIAAGEDDARAAMRRFVALAAQGRLPVRDLRIRIAERRPRRYRTALAAALRLLADGVQSALEQRYACDVERSHGIPAAVRQRPFVVDGRTLWEDAVYDSIGVPLTVRLDGRAFHSMPEVAFRDRRRDNAAELAGRHRLVFGWDEVTGRPCDVADEVFRVLRRSGWQGPQRACPACGS